MAFPTGTSTRCSRRDSGDLRLPRLSLADPSPDLPAAAHPHIHVRGYKEEGTTTTPFDMVMLTISTGSTSCST